MAASVEAKYRFFLDVVDQPAAGLDLASDVPYTHTIEHSLTTLNSASTPAVTKAYSDTITLSTGATVDLTSLPGPSSTTITFSGLKVQLFKMSCPSTNAAVISCTNGAANPYDIYGAAGGIVSVPPDSEIFFRSNEGLEDCDATHKDIDFAGTDGDVFSIQLVAG